MSHLYCHNIVLSALDIVLPPYRMGGLQCRKSPSIYVGLTKNVLTISQVETYFIFCLA